MLREVSSHHPERTIKYSALLDYERVYTAAKGTLTEIQDRTGEVFDRIRLNPEGTITVIGYHDLDNGFTLPLEEFAGKEEREILTIKQVTLKTPSIGGGMEIEWSVNSYEANRSTHTPRIPVVRRVSIEPGPRSTLVRGDHRTEVIEDQATQQILMTLPEHFVNTCFFPIQLPQVK